jgi:hypothetical protein
MRSLLETQRRSIRGLRNGNKTTVRQRARNP